jgi:two-component system response regulator YesN
LEITRTELANLVYFNPSYLSRLFKRVEGESISDFITRARIEKSKLLLKSSKSVHEAGLLVGYSNTSHFSSMFKKLVGISPREYRKNLKP